MEKRAKQITLSPRRPEFKEMETPSHLLTLTMIFLYLKLTNHRYLMAKLHKI